jgi:hypothetical protein
MAAQVRELHGTALSQEGLAILSEGSGGYVLAHYTQPEFRLLREVKVQVPALK